VPHVSQVELQSLRHLIGDCETKAKKLSLYADQCQNPELRNWCRREADVADRSRQTLLGILNQGVNTQ